MVTTPNIIKGTDSKAQNQWQGLREYQEEGALGEIVDYCGLFLHIWDKYLNS